MDVPKACFESAEKPKGRLEGLIASFIQLSYGEKPQKNHSALVFTIRVLIRVYITLAYFNPKPWFWSVNVKFLINKQQSFKD